MICNFIKSDLLGNRMSSTDCPVCRFLKRTLNIPKVSAGHIYTTIKGVQYSIKNYYKDTLLVEGTSNNIEIVGLEFNHPYWCIPVTLELQEMIEKILSNKIYDKYNNGTYDSIFFMKVQGTKEFGFYDTHPRDGVNFYPVVSIDFILQELEKLPNKEKLLSIEEMKPGDIGEVVESEKKTDVGEILLCIYNCDTGIKEVHTLVWNKKSCSDENGYCGPWEGKVKVKLLKSLTITRE